MCDSMHILPVSVRLMLGALCLTATALQLGAAEANAPLRVGVAPASPPMIFKQGAEIAGVEADLARALAQDLGRPVKFVELKWADLFPALAENRIDIIMSNLSVTEPRRFLVSFTESYLHVGQMMLVRRDEAYNYVLGVPYSFKGTIGVKAGTTGDFLVQQEFPLARRKAFASPEDAAKALAKKKIDLFISDSTLIWWLAGVNEANGLTAIPALLSREDLAWAVRKSDTDLLAAANRFLQKTASNGEFRATLKRWIPLSR